MGMFLFFEIYLNVFIYHTTKVFIMNLSCLTMYVFGKLIYLFLETIYIKGVFIKFKHMQFGSSKITGSKHRMNICFTGVSVLVAIKK